MHINVGDMVSYVGNKTERYRGMLGKVCNIKERDGVAGVQFDINGGGILYLRFDELCVKHAAINPKPLPEE